jgi:hypothetical protein
MSKSADEAREAQAELKAAKAKAKALRPWYSKKRFVLPGAFLIFAILSSGINGANNPSPTTPPAQSDTDSGEQTPTEETPTEQPAPTETLSQENARKMAETYLSSMAFSRTGLIEQLVFEGFSNEDAAYGTDAVGADWMNQAALMAETYLASMSFSRSGLVEQLVFEGFTPEEAEFGVASTGL